jgi:hypothetical protein
MPKPSTQPTLNEGDLLHALYQLNLFYSDESLWFETWAKKEHVDLFDVPIPIDAIYFKRSIGMSKRPLMILSEQSLARLCHCLFTANAKFDALAKEFAEKERLLFDNEDTPRP